jgi:hypothetical protein
MSKPIFIIKFPHLDDITKQSFELYYKQISKQLHDYHVLAIVESGIDSVQFECYNAPHTEIEFEELKQQVLKSLNM